MTTTTTVQKWGNSLAVRIPRDVADRIEIKQGTELELTVFDDKELILVPIKRRKKYSLEELVSKITPENRHNYIDSDREGRELI
ncbi:AbrB/MazE/SpoVT family DNA-binding domain-containing protein [Heliorestis acidaminivorans]|uniref:AbrB/MazE/SpoVT family DNA-binding domain-containing protein n=2 Tax=Heliorestis acidaminivorans TaxID=553427 RepID=A0A6I0ERW6_9FIRM|nr:AbrB/MazE/SpoVT family DNA-binding domain-containing protein [Heliorestis acidaminivorans]